MSNARLIAWSALASLAFANGAAFAQDSSSQDRLAENARREAEVARTQARREAEEARRASLQEELDRARDEMEQAAQEVARLSAEYAGPIVKDVAKNFRYAGQRAMLGLNITDTDQGARVNGVSPNEHRSAEPQPKQAQQPSCDPGDSPRICSHGYTS